MKKNVLLFIGFIISWIYSILIFYPQPGGFDWLGTAFLTLLYGFPWIILFSFFILGASDDENKFRKFIVNRYFTVVLKIILVLLLIITWNFKFSNDLVFVGYWVLVTLLWWNSYLNLKKLIKQ